MISAPVTAFAVVPIATASYRAAILCFGPSRQISHWNLMSASGVLRKWLALPESRNSVSAGQDNLVSCGAKPTVPRGTQEKSPDEIPGFRRFTWGRRI